MPTIHLEAEVSTSELLRAAEQLNPQEFEQFVARILALRAQRVAAPLSTTEAELLLQINRGLPEELQRRYNELIAKRRAEILTPEELAEIRGLSDQIEDFDVKRLQALVQLAVLRKTTLPVLMDNLGIPAVTHD